MLGTNQWLVLLWKSVIEVHWSGTECCSRFVEDSTPARERALVTYRWGKLMDEKKYTSKILKGDMDYQ